MPGDLGGDPVGQARPRLPAQEAARRLAAEAVAEAARAGDFSARGLGGYTRRWHTRFRTAFQLNRRMMWAFERPRLIDRVFRTAARDARAHDELVDVLSGEATRLSWRFVASVALTR